MSRASLRVKHQFRPVSTDLSNKLSAIGLGGGGSSNVAASKENDEVDGDSGGNGKASTGGVMLINYRKSSCEDLQPLPNSHNNSTANVQRPDFAGLPEPVKNSNEESGCGGGGGGDPSLLNAVMSSNEHLSLEAPDAKIKTKRKGLFNNKLEMSYQVSSGCSEIPGSTGATPGEGRKMSEDSASFILSSSLPDEGSGAQFESFSCTDEDSQAEDDEDEDEARSEEDDVSDVDSDVDSTGNAGTLHKSPKSPATNGNNIKNEDLKKSGIQKPAQFLRDKWRNSKNWGSNRNSSVIEEGKSTEGEPASQEVSPPANTSNGNEVQSSSSHYELRKSDSTTSATGHPTEGGRLSRLFSIRKSIIHASTVSMPNGNSASHHPHSNPPTPPVSAPLLDGGRSNGAGPTTGGIYQAPTSPGALVSTCNNPLGLRKVSEEEEQMLGGGANPTLSVLSGAGRGGARDLPPTLPLPPPPGLGPEELKRRHIVNSLVHSENNYVSSLQRLVNDYKRHLEETSPPILSQAKVQVLFHRVTEILNCHTLFRIALSEAIRNWDRDEAIGDVFVATFSKALVLEIYSEFINNFTTAMEVARQESKRKSAFADFLALKQINAPDRVSFFGLMVKPVQRFPQFILLLQDLLKETPPGHSDRMALQLALTTLESLAEMLNERKREAEQYAAFREKIRNISSSGKLLSVQRALDEANEGGVGSGGGVGSNHTGLGSGPPSLSSLGVGASMTSSQMPSLHCSQGGTPLRFLLREDNVTLLEFNSSGMIARTKHRRLLLLNDLLICVSVNGRSRSDLADAKSATMQQNERLTLKWVVPVSDVELVDGNSGGTLARMLHHGDTMGTASVRERKRTSLTRTLTPSALLSGNSSETSPINGGGTQRLRFHGGVAEDLAQDMNDLMHDFDVVSRISSLIGTLKGRHEGLNTELTSGILNEIQKSIRQKDEEMSWADASILQLQIRASSKNEKPESFTFQCRDPNVKKEWTVELRLAQLALDPNNSPAWDVLEQERKCVSTKMPLYVKAYCGYHSKQRQSEMGCGTSYTIFIQTATRALRPQTYVWSSANDGVHSYLRIFGVTPHQPGLKEVGTVTLPPPPEGGAERSLVRCMQYVPGLHGGVPTHDPEPLRGDLVWVGTDAKRIVIYSAMDPDRGTILATAKLPAEVVCIRYHYDAVWVGLGNGSLAVFRRNFYSLSWDILSPQFVPLGSGDTPVTSLLPVNKAGIYAACGKSVWVVDVITNEQLRSFVVQSRASNNSGSSGGSEQGSSQHVHQMAQSGVGLWISLKNSATICLYHTETFRHLQDINIASNVSRVLAARDVSQPQRSIHVTSLMASRGLLWVGTNVGIALTVPLPRLEGVPIISGRANISYHAHFGPVTFFLNVQHKVISAELPEYFHGGGSVNTAPTQTTDCYHGVGHVGHDDVLVHENMIREESEQDLAESEDNASLASFNGGTTATTTSGGSKSNCSTVVPPGGQDGGKGGSATADSSQTSLDKAVAGMSTAMAANKKVTALRHRNSSPTQLRARPRIRQYSTGVGANGSNGPGSLSDQEMREKRFSKTLPRGFSLANSEAAGAEFSDVYGLYGDLLNVTDYSFVEGQGDQKASQHNGKHNGVSTGGGHQAAHEIHQAMCAINDESRKSDPEISTIPYRVSTLDRRMRMKSSRPRSLDMSSTWSMDSRGSSASGGCLTSSSGASSGGAHATSSSSESGSERPSPCVSRNASFQSNHSCASSGVVTHHGGGGGLTVSSSVAAGQSMTSSTVSQSSSTDHHATSSAHIPPMHRLQPVPPLPKPPAKTDIPKMETPKTVTTLMGGRGYINWRRTTLEKQRTAALAQINNFDAFLVIWEMKT